MILIEYYLLRTPQKDFLPLSKGIPMSFLGVFLFRRDENVGIKFTTKTKYTG